MSDLMYGHPDYQPFVFPGGATGALLIHGFLGTPRELRPLGEALAAKGITAHGVLLPGFGPNSDRLKHVRAEDWLETARSAWREVRRESDRTMLIGFSMGGAVALTLAAEAGLAPDRLMLLAPHWKFADKRTALLPLAKYVLREIKPFSAADLANPDVRQIFSAIAPGADLDNPEIRGELIKTVTIPTSALDQLRRVGSAAGSAASRLTVPTTILQGLQDTTTLPAHSRTLARRIGAELVEFPGDHMIVDPAKPSWPTVRDTVIQCAPGSWPRVKALLRSFTAMVLLIQAILALRVVVRLLKTAGGRRIEAVSDDHSQPNPASIPITRGELRFSIWVQGSPISRISAARAPLPSEWERGWGEGRRGKPPLLPMSPMAISQGETKRFRGPNPHPNPSPIPMGAGHLAAFARDSGERQACVSIIVPVLNEEARIAPCLSGLIGQGPQVGEILVVDGGSTDDTLAIVAAFAKRDARIRCLSSPPHPPGINGKANNLAHGLAHANPASDWLLTIDADVRPGLGLVSALLHHAEQQNVVALSVATRQKLSGAAEALIHPAMLTTLVYRFGIPGHATADPGAVQANGQCFLIQRTVLLQAGGFSGVLDSLCEDVTLARIVAAAGHRVGFYETDDDLVRVEMYQSAGDAWRNWLRSLPMRDRFWGLPGWLGLAEVALVQAAPLPLALILGKRSGFAGILGRCNLLLFLIRVGVLAGTARAYVTRPWTYWLSPACDVPVAVGVLLSARRRVHSWRGRPVTRGEPR